MYMCMYIYIYIYIYIHMYMCTGRDCLALSRWAPRCTNSSLATLLLHQRPSAVSKEERDDNIYIYIYIYTHMYIHTYKTTYI